MEGAFLKMTHYIPSPFRPFRNEADTVKTVIGLKWDSYALHVHLQETWVCFTSNKSICSTNFWKYIL